MVMQDQAKWKVVVLDDEGAWQTLRICATYEEADDLIDEHTDKYPHAIVDLLEVPLEVCLTP